MLDLKLEGELPALTRLRMLRLLSDEERYRVLQEASEAIAFSYREDLAKPSRERELTAFTALDGVDPFWEGDAVSAK